MSKILKKESYKLKFDTSQANLDCFIRKKSKQKSSEGQAADKKNKKSRKKCKIGKEKNLEFEDNIFLQSVLSNVLNEQFVNRKEIKELIENMKFSSGENDENESSKQRKKIQESFVQVSQIPDIFNIIQPQNKSDINYKSIIYSCQRDLFLNKRDINHGCHEEKQENTTTIQSSLGGSPNSATPRSHQKPQIQQMEMIQPPLFELPYQYNPYYSQNNSMYQHHMIQRKKKTISGDQTSEYKIVLNKIETDGRTTIMIRHIPNKYTEDMLLEQINKNHRMKFNFLYLPIDYYNSCNVGYAFVNFIHTKFIYDLFKEFDGKRWNKFNSQKICELAYARIQGTTSLMDHFQNSHNGHPRVRISSIKQDKKPKVCPQLENHTFKDNNMRNVEADKSQEEF